MKTSLRFLLQSVCVVLFVAVLLPSCKVFSWVSVPKDIEIVRRSEWGAAKPVLSMKRHVPDRITIHHTATKQDSLRSISDKLKALQKFSMEKSQLAGGRIKEVWADIPYHFYIAVDGTIGEGRELRFVGDSNTPYDPTGHALIVLEGNFENEKPGEAQLASLQKLVLALAKKYRISGNMISGHKDHASTACPGANLYSLIPALQNAVDQGQ